jgi:GT2 family glycosyltransferase
MASVTNKLVSIIVINWNGIKYTRDCVKFLRTKTAYRPFEIIVVDNGSNAGDVKELKELHKRKVIDKLILNPGNNGFSGANNQGVEVASGDYFMLLNNDVDLTKNWLSTLVSIAEEDKKIGLIGPKITLIHTPNVCFGAGKITDSGASDFGYETKRCDVEQIGGAALMFKRSVLEKIGALDAGFNPAYFEECDFCLRARKAGFRVVFAPESEILHFENATLKTLPRKGPFIFMNKNRVRFMLIHFPKFRLLKAIPYELARIAKSIVQLRPHWLLQAYWTNIKNLDEIINKRQRYKKRELKP